MSDEQRLLTKEQIAIMKKDRSVLRRCWYCGKQLTMPYFRTVEKQGQSLRVHKSCVCAAEMLIKLQLDAV